MRASRVIDPYFNPDGFLMLPGNLSIGGVGGLVRSTPLAVADSCSIAELLAEFEARAARQPTVTIKDRKGVGFVKDMVLAGVIPMEMCVGVFGLDRRFIKHEYRCGAELTGYTDLRTGRTNRYRYLYPRRPTDSYLVIDVGVSTVYEEKRVWNPSAEIILKYALTNNPAKSNAARRIVMAPTTAPRLV